MKTKTNLITMLMVALLVSAVLILSCASPGDGMSAGPRETQKESNFKAPPGKGIVRLKVSDKNARTILPDADSVKLEDMWFKVEFFSTTDSDNDFVFPDPAEFAGATTLSLENIMNENILAEIDIYDIVITAFENQNGTNAIAGWDQNAPGYDGPYDIDASPSVTTITANLLGFDDGVSMGYFEYSVKIPVDTYNSAKFEITRYNPGPAFTDVSIDIPYNNTALVNPTGYDLPSGYYIVKVTLKKNHYQTIQYVYALHIYPAMTSKLDLIISDSLVKNEFEVSYVFKTSAGGNYTPTNTAGTFNAAYHGYAYLLSSFVPTPTVPSGDSFDGWFTTDSWLAPVALTERLFADRTLVGKFTRAGVVSTNGLTITFNFTDLANAADVSGTIKRNNFATASTVTLSLPALPPPAEWSGITWSIGDLSPAIIAGHLTDGGNTLTINNSQDFYSILAGPSFVANVTATVSGSTDGSIKNGFYSKNIKVFVTDN